MENMMKVNKKVQMNRETVGGEDVVISEVVLKQWKRFVATRI